MFQSESIATNRPFLELFHFQLIKKYVLSYLNMKDALIPRFFGVPQKMLLQPELAAWIS